MRSYSLLEQVQWKDLVQLGHTDVISELFISLPWLIVSFIFACNAVHYTTFRGLSTPANQIFFQKKSSKLLNFWKKLFR